MSEIVRGGVLEEVGIPVAASIVVIFVMSMIAGIDFEVAFAATSLLVVFILGIGLFVAFVLYEFGSSLGGMMR